MIAMNREKPISTKKVMSHQLYGLEAALGIKGIKDVVIKLPINGMVTAVVEFDLTREQVERLFAEGVLEKRTE